MKIFKDWLDLQLLIAMLLSKQAILKQENLFSFIIWSNFHSCTLFFSKLDLIQLLHLIQIFQKIFLNTNKSQINQNFFLILYIIAKLWLQWLLLLLMFINISPISTTRPTRPSFSFWPLIWLLFQNAFYSSIYSKDLFLIFDSMLMN